MAVSRDLGTDGDSKNVEEGKKETPGQDSSAYIKAICILRVFCFIALCGESHYED